MWRIPTRKMDMDEEKTFGFNHTQFLNGDTISSSTWIVPSELLELSKSNTTTHAYIKIKNSTGIEGSIYRITNRFIFAISGDIRDKSIDVLLTSE